MAGELSVFRYHEVSESTHRIMNPLAAEKLTLLAEICDVVATTRVLDLACGKAELLCQLAATYGASGVGIDIHGPTLAAGRARAAELHVEDRVVLVEGDASKDTGLGEGFDVVSCIGATWIGDGLTGTLSLMARHVRQGGWLLVGEVYWAAPPTDALRLEMEGDPDAGASEGYDDLAGTLERVEAAGYELEDMVLASAEDWDRYAASQWRNVSNHLLANPGDPDADALASWRDRSRRAYLEHERGVLGWGVFALRARTAPEPDRGA